MCGYLNSFACDVSRATGFGQLRLLCKHLILLVFGPMADDNIIPSCSKDKPSLVYIKRGGGQILLHAGHQYSRKEKYKNGAEVWECIHRRKVQCGGKITLKATDIIGEKQHKCTPDFAKNIIDERLNECKTKLSSSEFPTIQSTFDATVASCKDAGLDLIKTIPSFSSVRSTLYRHRNASVGMKKILFGNVEEVIVPDRYSDFLLADYSCQDKRILVFATQKGRNIMAKGEDFLGDGTFRSCSYPFQQLYVLHCDVGSTEQVTNIVPVVYALMSDKTTETYKILFFIIKAQIPEWTPVTFKTDFEMAVMNAISSVFPTVITKGCYFHFSKAIWKKGKELGLTNSKTTRRQVALSAVLPLLPANEIFNGWFYVAAQSPDEKSYI